MSTKQNIDASVIRAFLVDPKDRRAFEAFFKLTNKLTVNYLRYLRNRLLQIQNQYSNPDSLLNDIATDILGEFFQSKSGKPFFIIFDYFKRHGITDFDKISDGVLTDHYRNLLFGFCRKKIGHLRGESDPQIANLKRRFHEIISEPPYAIIEFPGENGDYVCLKKKREQISSNRKIIELTQLLDIVRTAFSKSKTRTQLVAKIFEILEDSTEYAPCIKKTDLVIALIEINCSFVDDIYSDIPDKYGFEISRVRELGMKYIPEVLDYLKTSHIEKYITKGKLSGEEPAWVINASRAYLEDFLASGSEDSVPTYFREHFPEKFHECYATDYKYIFDTVLPRGKELLIENIRNNL